MTEVRAAVAADSLAVARVHVRSWQSAFRGLIAQEYLDSLTPHVWAARYTFGRIGFRLPSTLVAVDGTTILGLATTGLSRDTDPANFGELMAIYVDPTYIRAGIGGWRHGCAAVGTGRKCGCPAVPGTRWMEVRRDAPHIDVRQCAGGGTALSPHLVIR